MSCDFKDDNHLWARAYVVPRASAVVRGMPVRFAHSSMFLTSLEKNTWTLDFSVSGCMVRTEASAVGMGLL